MMNILILSLFSMPYISISQAQEDEPRSPRLLSNQNTAAVTGAALGLGIGIAGSILVGKLIEDATKCKPQNVQPPAFGRFLPDLLNFKPTNCNPQYPQQNNYRQTQSYRSPGYKIPTPSPIPQSNSSPGYEIPSASTHYQHQQSVESGYSVPNLHQQSVQSGYSVPNLHQQSVESGYSVPNLQQQSVHSGYSVPNLHQQSVQSMYSHIQGYHSVPKNTYTPTASNQNSFSQTAPHKASIDPPRETIEIVNTDYTDYTDYTEYSYSPNSAIQPRHLGEDNLFKPIQNPNQRQPKAFTPVKQVKQKVENTFTQTTPHKAQPNSPDTSSKRKPKAFAPVSQTRQRIEKVENTFSQTAPHKAQPNSPKSHSGETREAKTISHQSLFTQTEAHKPKPNDAHTLSREGKSISSPAQFSATRDHQPKFQPLPLVNTEANQPKLFGQGREANKISHQSLFTQTDAHKPEPHDAHTLGREGKFISSPAKFSATRDRQPKFQPLPVVKTEVKNSTPAPFLGAFKPVSDSGFAPSPDVSETSFEPSQSIIIARTPKLFGEGRVRFEN